VRNTTVVACGQVGITCTWLHPHYRYQHLPQPCAPRGRACPSSRRLVTAAMRADRRVAPMHGLVDVDVTEANRLLGAHHPPWSLTAFVVASVARAAAAHPEVHAYRN
jgi:hypothetical protein